MSFTMQITNAGRAALVNATNTGTAPVLIAEFGISDQALVPDGTETVLPGELKRVSTLSGDIVDDDTIHLIVRDTSADAFDMLSWGLYLGDGTLFAVYGQATPILSKTAQSLMLMAIDVRFADIAAAALTFGDTNFLNPPATETVQGVVELATSIEAQAGTDPNRVPHVKAMNDAVTAWLNARFGVNNALVWNPNNDGAGSGLDSDFLRGLSPDQVVNLTRVLAALGYTPLNAANYTAADILAKLLTVDGVGSGLDAAFLAGQAASYYTNIIARLGFTPVNIANYTGADILAKLLTVDGSGSLLDTDRMKGVDGSNYARTDIDEIFNGLMILARASGEQLRVGYQTGAARDSYISIYDGLNSRRGYLQGQANFLRLLSDTGAYLDLYGFGDARLNGNKIYHSGNDGPGSGLHADLLDGYHASSLVKYADFTGSSQQLHNNGYQMLPGGLILQWGRLTASANAYSTASFPITFPNNCYVAFGSGVTGGGPNSQDNGPGVTSITNSQVQVYSADDTSCTFYYAAIGR